MGLPVSENEPLFDPTDVCPHGKHRIVRCKQCERENQPLFDCLAVLRRDLAAVEDQLARLAERRSLILMMIAGYRELADG